MAVVVDVEVAGIVTVVDLRARRLDDCSWAASIARMVAMDLEIVVADDDGRAEIVDKVEGTATTRWNLVDGNQPARGWLVPPR